MDRSKPLGLLREAMEEWPWIIGWIVSIVIVGSGIYHVLSFLPDSWGTYDEDGEFWNISQNLTPFLTVCSVSYLFHLFRSQQRKISRLKTAIQIRHFDAIPARYYQERQDLAFGFVLKMRGVIERLSAPISERLTGGKEGLKRHQIKHPLSPPDKP